MDMKIMTAAALAMATTATLAQKADAPFLRIGEDVTSWGEFEHLYEQNRTTALTPMSKQEYATLFTNYKLKATEARAQKIDTLATYRDECKYYLDELANGYLEDTMAVWRIAAKERQRLGEEIHAAHVLISVRPNASAADTLKAYKQAQEARQMVESGIDFATVADKYSADPSAKTNHGDLGYFSAMQMVEQFEDAAYATAPGQTSGIFRTRFGYHFLKVYDRRPTEGEVRVRHIMKIVPAGAPTEMQERVKQQIDSIYDAIVNHGADFEAMAQKHSDDAQSAPRGGLMPWFSRDQILPEFANAAFDLKEDGDISAPVRTRAGWHIICRVGRRTMMPQEDFDKMIARAKKSMPIIKNAPFHSRMSQLAKEYGFCWDEAGRDTLIGIFLASPNPYDRQRALKAEGQMRLATLGGKDIMMPEAAQWADKWDANTLPAENATNLAYEMVRQYERGRLEDKYPEYRYTSAEYRDGLLVFEFMQRNIWNMTPDSAQVDSLFAAHPERYATGGSFDGDIYFCPTPKVAAKVAKLVAKGKKDKAAALALKTVSGPLAQGDIYDDYVWPIGEADPYVAVCGTVTNGTTQKVSECRGRVMADLQALADRKITEQLKLKYEPEQLIKIK